MKIEFELPWPSRGLSPNSRLTFYEKARLFKQTKAVAYQYTRKAMLDADVKPPKMEKKTGVMNVQLAFWPPVTRYHDEDNMLANCKATLDGIAAALQIDDTIFHFREQIWHPAEKPGRMAVMLEWEA